MTGALPMLPIPCRSLIARCLAIVLALVLAAVPLGGTVHAQEKPKQPKAGEQTGPVAANIDRNGVLILVRSALLALDQANKTGNYTVLRDLGAPAFQVNNAAKLAEVFAPQRADEIDLGGILVLEPQLTLLPQIEPNGMLHMAGFFPSAPAQVNFELLFAPVNREWRIFGLSVTISEAGPQAPETAPSALAEEPSAELPDPPTPTVNPKRKTDAKAE
jgi:hypothetical protein